MPSTSPLALRRLRPAIGIALLAMLVMLVASPLAVAAKPGILPRGPGFAAWEVQVGDIATLVPAGTVRPGLLVKAFSPPLQPPPEKYVIEYLDEADRFHQKVILYFTDTVDYKTGTVYPTRVKAWVDRVKTHPALYGYMSVKEPSWNRISLAEMKSLYSAYRAADNKHPVIALLGDTLHFGESTNPWSTGVANILWVDWYPVTFSKGYIAVASKNFPKVRNYVAAHTPGTPIWLMVQGHEYREGDQRMPTAAELRRQVSDGYRYLGAAGIAFYTWQNPMYEKDFKRSPALWSVARSLMVGNVGEVFVTR